MHYHYKIEVIEEFEQKCESVIKEGIFVASRDCHLKEDF